MFVNLQKNVESWKLGYNKLGLKKLFDQNLKHFET